MIFHNIILKKISKHVGFITYKLYEIDKQSELFNQFYINRVNNQLIAMLSQLSQMSIKMLVTAIYLQSIDIYIANY